MRFVIEGQREANCDHARLTLVFATAFPVAAPHPGRRSAFDARLPGGGSARGTAAGQFLVRLSRNWQLTDLNTSP
jgi:hypothetical protein